MIRAIFIAVLAAPVLLLTASAGLACPVHANCSSESFRTGQTLLAADKPSGIGPYRQITARILVMEPDHVWQAMMDWNARWPDEGKIRIVHAVNGRIVELRWQHNEMRVRDNQAKKPDWRSISKEELASHGIVISPRELSEFLGGHVPPGFLPKGSNRWIVSRNNSHVRVEWNARKKRLVFSDLKHGRKATLIILHAIERMPDPVPRAGLALLFTHKSRHSEPPGGHMQGALSVARVVPLASTATPV